MTIKEIAKLIYQDHIKNKLGFNRILGELEYEILILALEDHGFNKYAVSETIGMKRTTIIERIKRYGIHTPVKVLKRPKVIDSSRVVKRGH